MFFGVFFIFWPMTRMFEKHNIIGGIVIILFVLVGKVGNMFYPNIFQVWRVCNYILFFWLGFKIRQWKALYVLRRLPNYIYLIVHFTLFCVLKISEKSSGLVLMLISQGCMFACNVVVSVAAFLILKSLSGHISWKENKIFNLLAKNQMSIYLFHQQIIYIFIFYLNGVINPYINVLMNIVGALTISLLISGLFMKYRWTRFLIGEK